MSEKVSRSIWKCEECTAKCFISAIEKDFEPRYCVVGAVFKVWKKDDKYTLIKRWIYV